MHSAPSFEALSPETDWVFILPKKGCMDALYNAPQSCLLLLHVFLAGEGTCASQNRKDSEPPGGSELRDASRNVVIGVTEE